MNATPSPDTVVRVPVDLFRSDAPEPRPGDWRLLGADCSYYTAKISAYLRYKRIPHANVLATREIFTREILPRVGWPVIPVLISPEGNTLQDTSVMFDHLEARYPAPATLPPDPAGRFLAYLLELVADEWLKVPALHYRWHYDADFAANEFGRNNDPRATPEKQREIGQRIAARFSGWTVPLGANPASFAAIETEYHRTLELLDAHLAAQPYLLGAAPTLADFALYGPLHAHLFRDPVSGQVIKSGAPAVVDWICRMGTPPSAQLRPGAVDVNDTLVLLVRHWLRDYIPVLISQSAALDAWLISEEAQEVPRELGTHSVVFGRGSTHEVRTTRRLFAYDQWMLQRVLAVYRDGGAGTRAEVKTLCEALGMTALLRFPLTPRLERVHNQLRRR